MNAIVKDFSIVICLVAGLLLLLELGYRAGVRGAKREGGGEGVQVGAIQGATLGLLGLLLAFSFSAAAGRFFERQDLIVSEANAIGTATLRAELLDEPHRSELRAALKEYTEYRIAFTGMHGADKDVSEAASEVDRQQARIWSAARAGVTGQQWTMLGVLPPVNEVIDLHSERVAATKKHIPMLVMSLLVAASLLSIGCLGYSSGLGGHRRGALTVPLALLIGASLWITIDLDNPREGLLQQSDAPLKALKFEAPLK